LSYGHHMARCMGADGPGCPAAPELYHRVRRSIFI